MKRMIPCLCSLVLLCGALGCVHKVFNEPTTISTKSKASQNIRLIKKVTAEYSTGFFILFPIAAEPAYIFDDLLAEAKAVGGNAVVDVQFRYEQFIWAFPPIIIITVRAEGTAAFINNHRSRWNSY